MEQKVNWSDRITSFSKTIHAIFITNLFMLLTSFPALFNIWFVPVNSGTFVFYLLSFLCVTPSISAGTYCIWKYIKNRELNIAKNFIRSYKQNFLQALIIGFFQFLSFGIMFFDLMYIQVTDNINKNWLFLVTAGIFLLVSMYVYEIVLMSRFNMKTFDVIKRSLIFIVRFFPKTFLNFIILFGIYMLHNVIPSSIWVTVTGSLIIFLILKNLEKEIKKMERLNSESKSIISEEVIENGRTS